jgi:dihydrodipicolinate synthase/N-acetylneuraminate lyase
MSPEVLALLQRGVVIPACPLALTPQRKLDERRQRALCRYYLAAGAGGLAVGVHTTQFAIRDPGVDLFAPVLELAAEEMRRAERPIVRIGGICGTTRQAVAEAELLARLQFDAGLLSLAALGDSDEGELIEHCRVVAQCLPIVGFYLQSAVGGRFLSYAFWRRFLEIENVVAVKIAPFSRYRTLDVMRAIADSQRREIAIYTGNDDQIVLDLVTGYPDGVRIVGGLLGHWAVWTRRAVELLAECHAVVQSGGAVPPRLLQRSIEVTDCNAAFFDAPHGFSGCIAGLHEVLRRQGLLEGIWCLDERAALSPGQAEEIDRVYRRYPHLNDDDFVMKHRDNWLRP